MAKYGEGVVVGSSFIKTIGSAEKGKSAALILEKTKYFTEKTEAVDVLPSQYTPKEEGILMTIVTHSFR